MSETARIIHWMENGQWRIFVGDRRISSSDNSESIQEAAGDATDHTEANHSETVSAVRDKARSIAAAWKQLRQDGSSSSSETGTESANVVERNSIQCDESADAELKAKDDNVFNSSDSGIESDNSSGGWVLALDSRWLLSASVLTEGMPKRNPKAMREALKYRFEESLPVPIEDLVVDVALSEDQAFCIGTEAARLQEIVEAMESEGLAIEYICPHALLVFEKAMDQLEIENKKVAIQGDGAVDLLELDENLRLKSWRTFTSPQLELNRFIHSLTSADDGDPEVVLLNVTNQTIQNALIKADIHVAMDADIDTDELLVKAATDILSGNQQPLINLRCDQLAVSDRLRQIRGSLRWLCAAAMIALILTATALWWRAGRYERVADTHQAELVRNLQRSLRSKQPTTPEHPQATGNQVARSSWS